MKKNKLAVRREHAEEKNNIYIYIYINIYIHVNFLNIVRAEFIQPRDEWKLLRFTVTVKMRQLDSL